MGQGRGGVKAGPEQGGGAGSRLGLQEGREKGLQSFLGEPTAGGEKEGGLELGCTCFDVGREI